MIVANGEEVRTSPTPVILDVDPGHDDAVAIMLACGAPALDLMAVTTVAGNAPLEKTTRNALRVLSMIGHPAVPVAAGASSPLHRPLITAEDIHGESGLEGAEIPDSPFEPDGRGATELIADALREAPVPVTLIPTGPLTNIATFLREHPGLRERVAHISLMGGSIGLGNTTPAAEFNIYVDPEAAREVFGSDAPPLHDPVAVAAVLEPGPLKTRSMRVDIECESELTRGETVCDYYGVTGEPPNAEVGVELDMEGFFELLYRTLTRL